MAAVSFSDLIGTGDELTRQAASFSRLEGIARRLFEQEEFVASARSWKKAAAVGKQMGRDDFRSLAYRHLSFALRGCGQVREADEAYRRALKYEQRAAPSDSPKTKTKGGTTAAKLLYDSELTDGGGDDEEDIMKKHHNTLIDSKHHDPPVSAAAVAVAEHLRDLTRGRERLDHEFVSTVNKYDDNEGDPSASLHGLNISLRDKVKALEAALEHSRTAMRHSEDQRIKLNEDVASLKKSLMAEEDAHATLQEQIAELTNSATNISATLDQERQSHIGTIDALQSELKAEQVKAMEAGDESDRMSLQLQECQRKNSTLEESESALKEKVAGLTASAEKLRAEVQTLISENAKLTSEIELRDRRLEDLKQAERERQEDRQRERLERETKREGREATAATSAGRARMLQTELANTQEEIVMLRADMKRLQAQCETQQNKASASDRTNRGLELQLQQSEAAEIAIRGEKEAAAAKADNLSSQVHDLQSRLEESSKRYKKEQTQAIELRRCCEDLGRKLNDAKLVEVEACEKLMRCENDIQKLNERIAVERASSEQAKAMSTLRMEALGREEKAAREMCDERISQLQEIRTKLSACLDEHADKERAWASEKAELDRQRIALEARAHLSEHKEKESSLAHSASEKERVRAENALSASRAECLALREDNARVSQAFTIAQERFDDVERMLETSSATQATLEHSKQRARELQSQVTRATTEIDALSSQLSQTLESSKHHEHHAAMLRPAQLKIEELSSALTKSQRAVETKMSQLNSSRKEYMELMRGRQTVQDKLETEKKLNAELSAQASKREADMKNAIEEFRQTLQHAKDHHFEDMHALESKLANTEHSLETLQMQSKTEIEGLSAQLQASMKRERHEKDAANKILADLEGERRLKEEFISQLASVTATNSEMVTQLEIARMEKDKEQTAAKLRLRELEGTVKRHQDRVTAIEAESKRIEKNLHEEREVSNCWYMQAYSPSLCLVHACPLNITHSHAHAHAHPSNTQSIPKYPHTHAHIIHLQVLHANGTIPAERHCRNPGNCPCPKAREQRADKVGGERAKARPRTVSGAFGGEKAGARRSSAR